VASFRLSRDHNTHIVCVFFYRSMTKIYLVRHGESVANTQGIYQGITYNTPLSDLGSQQARALAGRFQNTTISKIIASPLERTHQTASIVGSSKQINIEIEKNIIETNHGLWEGEHKNTIAQNWPDLYKKWQKFPSGVQFPDGEHFLDTQKRVLNWWKKVVSDNSHNLLVVSHDNIIRIIIAKVLNMKLNRIWKFHLHPTAVTVIDVEAGNAGLVDLNNASHLGNLQTNLALHAL